MHVLPQVPLQAALRLAATGTRHAFDALCPPTCALCAAPGTALCAACRADASPDPAHACGRCAIPMHRDATGLLCGRCLKRLPAFDRTVVAALYDAPFDQLVRGLKYGATLPYAPLFARLLLDRLSPDDAADIDVVLPVPLSRARMAARGFNQAIEIARPLAKAWKKPLDVDSVLRVVDTAPQAALPLDARRRNVRGAFAVVDARRAALAGRRIAVVDDVMTTGATLDELARTLKRAGAAGVVNLVVARTP